MRREKSVFSEGSGIVIFKRNRFGICGILDYSKKIIVFIFPLYVDLFSHRSFLWAELTGRRDESSRLRAPGDARSRLSESLCINSGVPLWFPPTAVIS